MKNGTPKKFGRRYPWRDWFRNREPFTLLRFTHFDILPYSMGQMVRNAASRYGLGVSVNIGEDRIVVQIRKLRRAE